MARRALKGINWAAIAERIPESEKTAFAAMKSRSDGYLQRVTELPEAPHKIDWALYKKTVPVPGMVDSFQKQYESLKIPYPSDTYTSKIEAYEKEVMDHVAKFIEESKQRVTEYQAEAEKLKNMLPFDQMTLEDFAEAYPENSVHIDRPTIWPHDEADQPEDPNVSPPMPKVEH